MNKTPANAITGTAKQADGSHLQPTTTQRAIPPSGRSLTVEQSVANMAVADLSCLLKPEQAAAVLNLAVKTLANDRTTHALGIPFARFGSAIRYRPSDLLEYIESRLVRPTSVKQ